MKNYLLLFIAFFSFENGFAQDPNWSVNANDYQYSMTFTTFLNVNGQTLTDTSSKVGAFVNGEIRGVANVAYVSSADKYVAYLSVFANTNGENISFKIFNSATETVLEVDKTQSFVIDGNVGGIFQSYAIASPALSSEAVLNSFSFANVTPVSQSINNQKINVVVPTGTDVTNLIAQFSVSSGAKFFVESVQQVSSTSAQNFTNTVLYKLLSEDEAVLIEYDVTVSIENTALAQPNITLSSAANSFVKTAPILVNMATNSAILNFTEDAFLVENAIVSSIEKVNDLLYTIQIVPIQQGVFSLEIPENAVFNLQNLGNLASNKVTFNYDLLSPYLLSIKRKNPVNEITTLDVLEFTVVFSEAVENVFSNDFETIANATHTVIKENETTYTLKIEDVNNFSGVISLRIKNTNTIQDKAGNLLENAVVNGYQN
jgi:hypothetical protein